MLFMLCHKFRINNDPADILILIKWSISTLWVFLHFLQNDNSDPAQKVIKDSLLLDTLVLIAGCLVVGACMSRFIVTALLLTSPDLKPVIGGNSEGNSAGHLCGQCCTWWGWWCFFLGLPQPCSLWSHPHPSYYPCPSLAPRSPTRTATPPTPIQNMQIFYNPAIKLFGVFYGASCAEQQSWQNRGQQKKEKKSERPARVREEGGKLIKYRDVWESP